MLFKLYSSFLCLGQRAKHGKVISYYCYFGFCFLLKKVEAYVLACYYESMGKKADLLFFIITLAAASVLWLVLRYLPQGSGTTAVVTVAGSEYGRYDLSEDLTVTLPGADGGYNVLTISGHSASVTDADCPDRLCVRQGMIAGQGASIVCLPHQMAVRIDQGKEGELDAVTY